MTDLYEKLSRLSPERRALFERKLAEQGLTAPTAIPRRPRGGPLPLGFAQSRLWFMQRLEPGSTAYNMLGALRLTGPLDRAALTRALGALVARHETLRTRYALGPGEAPVQVIGAPGPVTLEETDLSAAADPEAEARARLRALAALPHALEEAPLRLELMRLGAEAHVFAFGMHHIASDRWSMGVFTSELARLYAAARAGRDPAAALPPRPLDYADWALWQRERLEGGALAPSLEWWRARLSGPLPLLELPFDRPRGPQAGSAGGTHALQLPDALATGLRGFAKARGVSLFTLLLAVFKLALSRWAEAEDIIVGSEVASRERPETEAMIGPLVNTLVLRTDLSGDPDFETLLARVSATVRESFARQDLPFERVVEAVNPERRPDELNPLFQAKFDLQHAGPAPARIDGLTLARLEPETGAAKYELRFNLEDRGTGIGGRIEYAAGLFEPATIARMAGHFETLCASILSAPEAPVSTLEMRATAEIRAHAAARPVPLPAPPACIHTLFEAQAARTPEAPALRAGAVRLSYAGLDAAAERIADALAPGGPGRLIGLCMARRAEMVAAMLGVLKAGCAYVPLDSEYPAERLELIAADAGLATVLTAGGALPFAAPGVTAIDVTALPGAAAAAARPAVDPDALSHVIYTSGSTGRPKGVPLRHRNVAARLAWARAQYRPEELARVLASTSMCFDLSVFEIFAPLAAGGEVVLADTLFALPEDAEVTLINTVPSLLRAFLGQRELPASLRALNLAGEAFPPALLGELRARAPGLRLFNLYGPSEDTTYSTCAELTPDMPATAPLPIGTALPGTAAHVLDRLGRPVPDGLAGELCLAGEGLAEGYLDRPAQTAERFVEARFAPGLRLYRTGDRVRRRADGALVFLGRLDHQVKLRGLRIETGEVEHHLEAHAGVAEAVVRVTGAEGAPDRQLAAHVVLREGADVDVPALRAHLAARLPAHQVPGLWALTDSLPRLPNGKVNRAALPDPAPAPATRSAAPETGTQALLARIWAEALEAPAPGIDDDFFALGGHSLLAIRIMARIETERGIALPLKALFAAPTVRGLAEALERAEGTGERAPARPPILPAPEDRHAPFPLTDIQHAYWMGRQKGFALGEVGAHGYREFEADGLEPRAVEAALRALVARHDMLRAVVTPDGNQRVLEEVPDYALAVTDLTRAAAPEARLEEIRARLSHQVFDPEHWPLFHVEAARLPGGATRYFVSFDVLIGDAWSVQILASELAALLKGEAPPPLTLSFRDCVLAERAEVGSPGFARAEAHWQARIAALPPAPDLPLVMAPEQLRAPRFTRRRSGLAAADWARLKARAAAAGLTPTSAVLAAFAEVLARWSRSPAFTLNLTLFNRPPLHEEIGRVVGDFTASMLLGVTPGVEAGFAPRARALQDRLLDDLDHRALGGVEVLRRLAKARGKPAAGLMPVVFTSTLAQSAPRALSRAFDIRMTDSVSQTPQVFLDHQVSEQDGALTCNWDAVEALFPAGMLDALCQAHQRLLDSLAAPGADWDTPLPDPVDARHLDAMNAAAVLPLPGGLLHDEVFARAAETPERPAVIGAGEVLSYAELAGRARALAARLQAEGAGPNTLVAIGLPRGPEQVVACLGVLAAGAAYVPVDHGLPPARRAAVLEETGAALGICEGDGWPEGLTRISVPRAARPVPAPVGTAPHHLAYVIFTSGSTGRPKGVMIDHRGAVNTVAEINRRFGLGAGDRSFALSALGFDLSVWDMFGPLSAGGAVVVPGEEEARNPALWPALLTRHAVTVWNSVPALAQLLAPELARAGEAPPLRLVMMSGDWIPLPLPGALTAALPGAELVSLGGATEASIWSVFHPIGAQPEGWSSVPYGTPLANQRWHVLDAALRPCPPWVPGRLFIGGTGVARGYWGRPELTAERFLPDPFAGPGEDGALLYDTGDLGRWRPDCGAGGGLEFLGRDDFQVKVNGYRIELGEIEAALLRHPSVGQAVAVVHGTPPALAAYVVPSAGQDRADTLDARAAGPARRTPREGEARIALPPQPPEAWLERQSHRRYLSAPLPLERLSALLAGLRASRAEGAPLAKFAYPSAGSLYPVQGYLMVRPGRVEGLEPGWYHLDPEAHALTRVAPPGGEEAAWGRNAELAADSAFTLFLVADIAAAQARYGDQAEAFCLLEAGHMGQLLMSRAGAQDIGLCPLGGTDATALARTLGLGADERPLYALCGGAIAPAWAREWQALAPDPLPERLSRHLGRLLPGYMVPRDILPLAALPLTANGKLDRKALPAPGTRQRAAAPPETEVEARVLALWRELLEGEAEPGVEDHFFEAGGNSLTAMRLLSRLQEEFAVPLTLAALLAAPTPRAQAALVTARAATPPEPAPARSPEAMTDAELDAMLARLSAADTDAEGAP
ncbi:non-ribosomal peptide synthetase [Oceanicella sp. SM1341]|uniref:non-ribosomal peptide synthetase n=1 Tax=Oceanicella sp. SM1341 TaxID=1548889 RepID=UPI000E4CA2A3|nr:non-ribosomal peptide synthetase [Oceanicella sp. SM1341]